MCHKRTGKTGVRGEASPFTSHRQGHLLLDVLPDGPGEDGWGPWAGPEPLLLLRPRGVALCFHGLLAPRPCSFLPAGTVVSSFLGPSLPLTNPVFLLCPVLHWALGTQVRKMCVLRSRRSRGELGLTPHHAARVVPALGYGSTEATDPARRDMQVRK